MRFHDMRHTATTLMISNGVDLKTVKEICGHASIQTTMEYAHLVGGSIERVAEAFSIGRKVSSNVNAREPIEAQKPENQSSKDMNEEVKEVIKEIREEHSS